MWQLVPDAQSAMRAPAREVTPWLEHCGGPVLFEQRPHVRIPWTANSSRVILHAAEEGTRMASTEAPAEQPRILAVDDNRGNLLALEVALEPLGYTLVTAPSGAEALGLVRDQEFVTILMDIRMPAMDGYETTARIRKIERARDVPIVFLTAMSDEREQIRRGYELGAVDYLAKPIDDFVLRAKVRALVALYLRGQEAERRRSHEHERIKDIFFSAAGHDLRNPLGAIAMASRAMQGCGCTEASHATNAARIEQSARRMTAIVDDIHDLARGLFSGGVPVSVGPMDLAAVCERVVEELRLVHAGQAIELDVAGDVHGCWDAERVARVVSNLVGNAIEHGRRTPVRITGRGDDQDARIEVINQGDTIPEDELRYVFEPFRHGASSRGLGLGLYIVHEIVRAHGGQVAVRSGGGETVFSVTLPKMPLAKTG
ncbi:MAG TPA: hybrid sensor histidine kinase/response regulator [Polyangiaceae bacterium]